MITMTPIISLQNISIFQEGNPVLENISFDIKEGDFIYLIGKTGSGKSSLLRTIYADLPIQKGEGIVTGYNLKRLTPSSIPYLRRKIGIIFQDFKLFNDRNVNKNLEFVL